MSSVLKSNRSDGLDDFRISHHYDDIRKKGTELALRDFGFSMKKCERKISHNFKDKPYEELTAEDKAKYDDMMTKDKAIEAWFIEYERKTFLEMLRQLGTYLWCANGIYPEYEEELSHRRLCQEEAVGMCTSLQKELQYIAETLPVDINKYTELSELLYEEESMIKGWRRSDHRFKKTIICTKKPEDEV